jgi:D-arabinose 1-dehydrogenase-like Zn-dependent alcohol dehydrogenase
VREQLGSAGIDIVVDVAGAGEVDAAASLLAPGGVVAAIGMLDGAFSWDRREIAGHAVAPISVGNRQEHEAMLAFVERRGIHPVVDIVYNLADLRHALRRLRSGDFFGKIGIDLT